MGVIIYSFHLNISPNMSYGGLECDIVMLQNRMLMIFVIKDFVIKKGGVICAEPCIHMTHGHGQWWGDCLRELGGCWLDRGTGRKIGTTVIA